MAVGFPATWEDFAPLRQRFPQAPAWPLEIKQVLIQGKCQQLFSRPGFAGWADGLQEQQTEDLNAGFQRSSPDGPRRGERVRKPNVRVQGPRVEGVSVDIL